MLSLYNRGGRFAGLALTGAAVALISAAPSHAQLSTFAEFGRRAATQDGSFVFTNNGASSNLSVLGGSIPVRFQYDTDNYYDVNGFTSINATLSVTGTVSGPAVVTGNQITQSFSSVTFTYTAVTPKSGFSNLLTATFNASQPGTIIQLQGTSGSGAATLSVSRNNASGVAGFSSDFLDFGHPSSPLYTSQQFSVSLSGVNNSAVAGNGMTVNGNGYVNSFVADGTGTFSSNPPPPSFNPVPATPGQVTMLIGLAMGGLQYGRVRFVRKGKKTAPKA